MYIGIFILCLFIYIYVEHVEEAFQEQEELGFMVTRCVRKPQHNILYKECYEAIRRYHPDLKIIFIDDNSDKDILEEHPMTNVEIIQSEYPAAGEYLCYWYMLQRKPFKKAIFLQDSMILNGPIPHQEAEEYMFLYEVGRNMVAASENAQNLLQQTKIPEDLLSLYASDTWSGCWGSMMVITSDFIDRLEAQVGISSWISSINTRATRIGLESAIAVACIFIQPKARVSLFGPISEMNVMKYPGNEKYTLEMYLADKNMIKDHIIKIWNGR